ncbi:MAG: DUF885 family protein [Bryobacteraceae bacterium]|nr:DUF885 family protein [Bryobacteraceae bacterium]
MTSVTFAPLLLLAQSVRPPAAPYTVPALDQGMPAAIELYQADRGILTRFHDSPLSPISDARMRQFYQAWSGALDRLDFERLDRESRIDWLLLKNRIGYELHQLDETKTRFGEMSALLPFAPTLLDLKERRQRQDPLDSQAAAAQLAQTGKQLEELLHWVNGGAKGNTPPPTVARRAIQTIGDLRSMMKEWFGFYSDYDPLFTWWVTEPHKKLDQDLDKYAAAIRDKLTGVKRDDRDTILGDPIGREALLKELRFEMIPYSPEQLVAIANEEFAWCAAEMRKASRELGFGDDWKRALEHVKTLYVPPGKQTSLTLELANEAIAFVEKHQLVTVPALARDTWRMTMMSPERQRIAPFFLGGESVIVSYPTSDMPHETKMMAMRGNNIHFSRAVVHHELIPGHNLQAFMTARYRAYRRPFRTPFWIEGWALHFEFLLYDLGFPKTAEDRVGMLFWRMHRCARIIFSLNFHLGKMTAQECVDFLVDKVGHERDNASGEVRRSFESAYGPLYQAAYMLGALQIKALHEDLVKSGKMSSREFHDAILRGNSIPIEMVRASLKPDVPLTHDFEARWLFRGEIRP